MILEVQDMKPSHLLLCTLVALMACGSATPKSEQPHELAQDDRAARRTQAQPVSKMLAGCETLSAAAGLVELQCAEHRLVEFRKPQGAGLDAADADLDELMRVLEARFGALTDQRSSDSIDGLSVRVSEFSGAKPSQVSGRAVVIANQQGRFWGLACYRKEQPIDKRFCTEAIWAGARAGGLAHVGALPLKGLWGGLRVPEGCRLQAGHKIHCKTGELSWMPVDGRDPRVVRDETLQLLGDMAKKESVVATKTETTCKLLGKSADCTRLVLGDGKGDSHMNFVFVVGGEPESLVACIYGGKEPKMPEPCDQAIAME